MMGSWVADGDIHINMVKDSVLASLSDKVSKGRIGKRDGRHRGEMWPIL